jgi:transposase-like protein
MGDRFYQQQLAALGSCPGSTTKPRRKRVAWDDDMKARAIEMYTSQNPTPENSMEIVKEIASELGESPNGVRMVLSRAEVYVKKTPASGSARTSSGGGGGRVSVADAQDAVRAALSDAGIEPDDAIISKLTGKAAKYFAEVITKINEAD